MPCTNLVVTGRHVTEEGPTPFSLTQSDDLVAHQPRAMCFSDPLIGSEKKQDSQSPSHDKDERALRQDKLTRGRQGSNVAWNPHQHRSRKVAVTTCTPDVV